MLFVFEDGRVSTATLHLCVGSVDLEAETANELVVPRPLGQSL